jgi:hypothetical protein
MTSNGGAQFEIIVDGKTRSWRDDRETAMEAARYLKERSPNSAVAVRDLGDDTTVQVLSVEKLSTSTSFSDHRAAKTARPGTSAIGTKFTPLRGIVTATGIMA